MIGVCCSFVDHLSLAPMKRVPSWPRFFSNFLPILLVKTACDGGENFFECIHSTNTEYRSFAVVSVPSFSTNFSSMKASTIEESRRSMLETSDIFQDPESVVLYVVNSILSTTSMELFFSRVADLRKKCDTLLASGDDVDLNGKFVEADVYVARIGESLDKMIAKKKAREDFECFLTHELVDSEGSEIDIGEIASALAVWARKYRAKALDVISVGKHLTLLGYTKRRSNGKTLYADLTFRPANDPSRLLPGEVGETDGYIIFSERTDDAEPGPGLEFHEELSARLRKHFSLIYDKNPFEDTSPKPRISSSSSSTSSSTSTISSSAKSSIALGEEQRKTEKGRSGGITITPSLCFSSLDESHTVPAGPALLSDIYASLPSDLAAKISLQAIRVFVMYVCWRAPSSERYRYNGKNNAVEYVRYKRK